MSSNLYLSLAAKREPKDDEARLLQQPDSEEARTPPWLFAREMAMGCDLSCEHFSEKEAFSAKFWSRFREEEEQEERQSEEDIDDDEDRDVGVACAVTNEPIETSPKKLLCLSRPILEC